VYGYRVPQFELSRIDPNHSFILATSTSAKAEEDWGSPSAAVQRFPAGFDDRDVAILQWIAAEGRRAKRSYL
jgi:hypothetical protein